MQLQDHKIALSTICIVTCWYGKYPWYFPYFIKSCAFNPTIDFIIITDNEEFISAKPTNVKILYKTIDEIKKIASDKLKINVNIDYPYKLCDFKPTYGFIFHEILKEYDFWGHGDIDLIYGNIRDFMTEEILSSHDIISSRHDYIAGSFSLFRNKNEINTLFFESRDYIKVFTNPEHFCFDECNFLFSELDNGASILDYPNNIQSMTYLVKRAEADGKLKAFFDFIIIEGVPGKVKWENGKIIYKNMFEAMYYNLIRFKKECKVPEPIAEIPNVFSFTPKLIKF
ncbi:DUF6625 family protein [Chryseobacterium paridis]|uniref:Uncharacterized protein n=1 Tax=Chryseobacterium paridis TaxID=2800328 RepID=A0ABS1FSG7_9FLAO|nr:DUF6625 family protein [Chryseobacterium paridis]MBK1895376.1 hypothetical protein [Chryseobacterium paridis]